MPTPLSLDTAPEVECLQVEGWRRMSPAEKAALVSGLSRAVDAMAWAGARHRHPGASERELFLRVAIARLGRDLAVEAYPDAAGLVDA